MTEEPVSAPTRKGKKKRTLEEIRLQLVAGLKGVEDEHARRARRFVEEAIVAIGKASEHSKNQPYKDSIDKANALLVAALPSMKVTVIQ
jgi:ERCC4-type nuclease